DQLGDAETERWQKLNAEYRSRHGFPFIICVRAHDRAQIARALKDRLHRDTEAEVETALQQIDAIATFRFDDKLAEIVSAERLGELDATVQRDLAYLAEPEGSWVPRTVDEQDVECLDVAIVGGGQSGLGAAFGLLRAGVDRIAILDENPAGYEGPWVTYARMRTLRTPKHLTGLDGGIPSLTFRAWYTAQFGDEAWEAVGKIPRRQWMAYLRWFRATLDLPVRNNVRVTAIHRHGDRFQLELNDGDAKLEARKVILATGIQGGGEWHTPQLIVNGLPRKLYAHTSEAIDFGALEGKSIGVLGSGASAFDNAHFALQHGVAEAHVFSRRERLPVVNPIRFMERTGFTRRYILLDDDEKYRALNHFLVTNQPPTNDTYRRASAYAGFALHLGSPWDSVEERDGKVHVTTPHGEFTFDFVVISTGLVNDAALRPELRDFVDDIAHWGETFEPTRTERNPIIDSHPRLTPGFELTGKTPEANQRLHGLFVFNYSALASCGLSASALSGMRFAVPRLVDAVTAQLFLDERERILEDYFAYDEPEFLGDE
ncbi:MAG: 2-oxo-4-hydroxy-4-carboxy-5-ureidoimidazoline decarboxylase, partial [Myxococcota bacterium]